MRLTKKVSVGYNPAPQKYGSRAIYNKLGQLEDVEDELGIDLITLFKAITDGFYYKDGFGDIEHLDKQTLHLLVGNRFQELKEQIKDYGKTWALTKEELSNDGSQSI